MENSSFKTACVTATILDDGKAKDITVLNISKVSVIADYFVICSADTPTQVKALTEHVREGMKKFFGRIPLGDERDLKNRWNLLDYGDVAVHILQRDEREIYAMEKFWNHALRVEREEWSEFAKEYSKFKEETSVIKE